MVTSFNNILTMKCYRLSKWYGRWPWSKRFFSSGFDRGTDV